MSGTWHALMLELPSDFTDLVIEILHEAGSNGSLEEKSKKEGFVRLTSFFDADCHDKSQLLASIEGSFGQVPELEGIKTEIVTSAATDWSREWRQWFKPFELVPGITVRPSWEDYSPSKGEEVIVLDPGMAFGTGLHPTTKLCAKAIYDVKALLDQPSLLDVGSGSGLLALVAKKMGIEHICAVETDGEAIRVANENLQQNGAENINVFKRISEVDGAYDIVVANILLSTLLELREELTKRTAVSGHLILSGITHDQEEEIRSAFSNTLTLRDISRMDEWSCISLSR